MTCLVLNNDYSYLLTEDNNIKNTLWKSLRKRKLGYYHTNLYKSGRWDGFINFFDERSGKFLTGLWAEVMLALKTLHHPFTIDDRRSGLSFTQQQVGKDLLPGITLEDYQCDYINQAMKYKRGIILAPTSAGKSFILVGMIKCLPPNTRTLVICNRKSVVRQNYKELLKWNIPNVGYFDSKTHNEDIITCGSVLSLHHLADHLKDYEALFVDEVHLMMSAKSLKIYKKLTNCGIRIGLSATPFKFGGKDEVQKLSVKGYFGPVFKTKTTTSGYLTTSELQERGRLAKSECIFYYVREPIIPHDIYIDAVTNGIAKNLAFLKMVTALACKQKGRTLILVERIAQGDLLHQMIPGSIWVQGKDDDDSRDYIIRMLSECQTNMIGIATQKILGVGVNFFISNLIVACGGNAEHDVIQRMGRGLRTAKDKDILHYYDFVFKINDYLEKHSYNRIKILKKEGHPVSVQDFI